MSTRSTPSIELNLSAGERGKQMPSLESQVEHWFPRVQGRSASGFLACYGRRASSAVWPLDMGVQPQGRIHQGR